MNASDVSIQRSAWKVDSANFRFTEFSEVTTVFSRSPCGERDILDTRRRTVPPPRTPSGVFGCYPLVARSNVFCELRVDGVLRSSPHACGVLGASSRRSEDGVAHNHPRHPHQRPDYCSRHRSRESQKTHERELKTHNGRTPGYERRPAPTRQHPRTHGHYP
jgi:hypothetical protein